MGLSKRIGNLFTGKNTDRRISRLFRRNETGKPRVLRRAEMGKNIAFISTFWGKGDVVETPFALGRELLANGFSVVLIITAAEGVVFEKIVARLEALDIPVTGFTLICRKNVGKDFGGFKDIFHLFRTEIGAAEKVFIGNDSLVGPLFRSGYFERIRNATDGVWGPTESFDRAYHLQSSHLIFSGARAIQAAQAFFDQYLYYRNRDNIVRYGEIHLTSFCLRAGCKVQCLYPMGLLAQRKTSDRMSGRKVELWLDTNPQHFFFDALMDEDFPFVKRELLERNPLGIKNVYPKIIARMEERGQSPDVLFGHFRPL